MVTDEMLEPLRQELMMAQGVYDKSKPSPHWLGYIKGVERAIKLLEDFDPNHPEPLINNTHGDEWCPKYDAEVLPDENGNCSLCNAHLVPEGDKNA